MTVEDFNLLVEQAYDAAFESEEALTTVYATAYLKQGERAASTFEQITAAWTPPIIETLTYGMDEQEVEEADRIRDEAAAAILAVFATLGLASVGREFLQAISERAQLNFEQEILRNLRKIVSDGFTAGLTSEQTAAVIREKLPQVIPSSAQMLAETELTTLVNQQALVAANKAFPDGVMKTWKTVGDAVVRPAHAAVNGTSVPQDQPFQVGNSSMQYPGDPSAPLRLTARCRCRLSFTNEAVTASGTPDLWYADDWYRSPDPAYDNVAQAADLAIVAALNSLADRLEMSERRSDDIVLSLSASISALAPRDDTEDRLRSLDAVEALQQVAERLASAVERMADNPVVVPPATVNVTLQAEPEKRMTVERDAQGKITGAIVEELPAYETEVESTEIPEETT